ncbi:ectoine/hydroxyectoine ABC transporter permease subunit EhuD [Salinicoccus roseus]|jgi:polar amino acid transport system permease protein|uniref:Ectoine/hydroxyectoine ABC transporter permease subunit EhuD n=1 Tax=Salinicoccus roseus TaxID=45670 RepID=A0A265E6W4_9STAP|nr:ectoine/hydroxyectoine ABC transporter permease subunit EhuD [Salinicoccus roseus]OZT76988.1 ectoine/hydroxyectoine ABC transporter permease subunit EhuD [Salinicoccus roseus]RPE54900.1 amino acid ABC transporter membrane protein 2 (PAAT family) [Salinicoccus roseus]GGA61734.1 ectoine/hydroxyectoine ABC transporter permease subunit EhuD [Salinicoccus roseus]
MSATYWSWETFFNAFPIILEGLKITLGLTIASYLLAMVAGFVWLILESTPIKPFNFIVYWIKEFIRSTPPIVQIFFLYFAWPMVPYVGTSFTPFVAAMLALGIHFSTYISEVYRSGIESVDKGQWEASTALNFSTRDKWTKIVLPQALPPTIPMLGNYLIILFKEVPLAATIGVVGILSIARSYGAQTWSYIEPLTIVALLFLLLSYPSALLIRRLENKMNRRFETKKKKVKVAE